MHFEPSAVAAARHHMPKNLLALGAVENQAQRLGGL